MLIAFEFNVSYLMLQSYILTVTRGVIFAF